MNQGFNTTFYAKVKFLKHKTTSKGDPFAFGVLSCWVYGSGYVNLPFKAFGNIAESLIDDTWIQGNGTLGNHSIQREKMELIIGDYEFAEQPENDYNNNNTYTKKESPKPAKQKPESDKPKNDDFDFDLDDFPF